MLSFKLDYTLRRLLTGGRSIQMPRLFYRTISCAEFLEKIAVKVDPVVAAAMKLRELVSGRDNQQPERSRAVPNVAMTLAMMERAVSALHAAERILYPTAEAPLPIRWSSVPNGQQVLVEFRNSEGTIMLSVSDEIGVLSLFQNCNSQPFLQYEVRNHGGRLICWPKVQTEQLISLFEIRSSSRCSGLLPTFSLFWRDIAYALDPSRFGYSGSHKSLVQAVLAFGCQEAWDQEYYKGNQRPSKSALMNCNRPFRASLEELFLGAQREVRVYRGASSPSASPASSAS